MKKRGKIKSRKRDKAQAGIIATVLLILLVIAVAVIISSFAFNFVQKQKDSSQSVSSFNYGAKIDNIEILGSLQNLPPIPNGNPSQILQITITRTDNEQANIKGVRFILEDNQGNSYSYDSNIPPEETGMPKNYEIKNKDINQDLNKITKVSISFILNKGNTNVLDEKDVPN